MKKIIIFLSGLVIIFILIACSCTGDINTTTGMSTNSSTTLTSRSGTIVATTSSPTVVSGTVDKVSVNYDSDDLSSGVDNAVISYIKFTGTSITAEGRGVKISGGTIFVTAAGSYSFSGILNEGQVIVDTQDKETVWLILDGVDITCSTSSPIYVKNAGKVVITLAKGTSNTVTDGGTYIFTDPESDEPDAAVFSHDALTINGEGSLTVNASYNNGIQSKDNLKIISGTIIINAVNDGIKGRDFIVVNNGDITIRAGGDGMQSNNDEDTERGFILIEGGTFNITAGTDGIQAETILDIRGGDFTVSTGGGSVNSSSRDTWGKWGPDNYPDINSSSDSAKGLKAGVGIIISGGSIEIDSSDDSIHSNNSIAIVDCYITLTSGDDGIHADSYLEVKGGDIDITKSYEGIESSVIKLYNGNIHIISSDDGINVVGGVDGSSMGGRPGQNLFSSSGNDYLEINGGYIYIDAMGDGIDVNGYINMSGGKVIVNGPTSNGNGPLDYLGYFSITGGYIVAAGSSGMAMAPSTSSTQYSVMLNLSSALPAGTMIYIESGDGKEVLTFVPAKAYQSVVLCSAELKKGSTYVVYYGGSSTGAVADGLYTNGEYSAGTQITSFTITNMVTTLGSSGGAFPGGIRQR